MSISVASPEDVINLALAQIHYPLRINSIFEGTRAAQVALRVYAETRDEALRAYDWNFAEQIAALVLTGQAAPSLWAAEYTYPATCLKIRDIYDSVAYAADKNNPVLKLWTAGNTAASGRVIWSDVAANATAVFTAQITDPTKWEPLFVGTLVDRLAKRLTPLLDNLESLKPTLEDEKIAVPLAESVIG